MSRDMPLTDLDIAAIFAEVRSWARVRKAWRCLGDSFHAAMLVYANEEGKRRKRHG